MKKEWSFFRGGLIHFVVFFFIISLPLFGIPIRKEQAQTAVRGWLRRNRNPMNRRIGDVPVETLELSARNGQTLCYIINLAPEGFVITSADDEIEPVIAFSSTGYYDGDEKSPLTAMLKRDMAGRLEAVRQKKRDKARMQKKLHKWQTLLQTQSPPAGAESEMGIESIPSVSDVWVDPFIQSLWDQGDVWDSGSMSYVHCYNYYTPDHYPCGCVATAMAQVMRYYSYPTAGIGVHGFWIKVDEVSEFRSTRGGDGSGGAYDWGQMPYDPQSGVTTAQREVIGALCYDAGVSVGMSYHSGASGANLSSADQRMTDTFDYSNSIYTQNFTSSGDDRLWNLLNANLDAQMPVMLGINGPAPDDGHAVIADGYGYNGQTLYHHINMGWGGDDNAWYQLPLFDAASYTFNVIDDAVYNIYTSGSGEIISGRVTDLAGVPLENVSVKAYTGTSVQKQTVTDAYGVYALTMLDSNTTYRISAEKTGETFLDQYVTTGHSSDWGTPGNRSGILFVSADEGPPTAFDVEAEVDSTDSVVIQLQVLDDGEPDPNLLAYMITSLPTHGYLSEPNVGPIDTVPYAMAAGDANGVIYTPCPYFDGQDTFTYKANDGGVYPTGGDSNIATVTVNVSDQFFMILDDPTSTYSPLLMDTAAFYDARAEMILLQSDIGPAQDLTDLALDIYIPPSGTLNNWTVRIQHTDWTHFDSVTTQFLTSGWTMVYQANETITQTGWRNFHFDLPFEYNGTQNLLVDISFNNTGLTESGGGYLAQEVTGTGRVIGLASKTGTHGNPLDWSFWALGGSYYVDYIPSMKLIGEVAIDPLAGDFDATCDVKLPDIAIFAQAWQTTSGDAHYAAECDLTPTQGTIDLQDLTILCDHWLDVYSY